MSIFFSTLSLNLPFVDRRKGIAALCIEDDDDVQPMDVDSIEAPAKVESSDTMMEVDSKDENAMDCD